MINGFLDISVSSKFFIIALVESALPAAKVYIRTSSAGSSLPKRIVNPFCNP